MEENQGGVAVVLEIEKVIIEIIKWLGYLGALYGFISAVLNKWDKKKKEQQTQKAEAEEQSHKPLVEKMEEMKEELTEKIGAVDKQVEELTKKVDRSLEINAANAELALSVADETAAHEVTNGRTKEAAAALRKVIYEKVRE